jgi:phosphatidate cytidylyltransferase
MSSPPSKLAVFGKRLSSTLVLWALLTAAMVYQLDWPFFILIGGLGLGSLWEFLQMDTKVPNGMRKLVFSLGCVYYGLLFSKVTGAISLPWEAADALIGTLVITSLFAYVLPKPLQGRETLWNILYPGFGFFYVAWLFGFMAKIVFDPAINQNGGKGAFYALFIVAATKFTDSGAYAIGSLIGRKKMIPHISPGKTWEGLGGAFLGAVVAGMAVQLAAADKLPLLGRGEALGLCFAIAIITVIGDLAESALKRCLEIKDSGKTLPGIGGALDLTDSLLYTAPLFYLYLKYVG